MKRRLGELQGKSRRFGEKKNFLLLPIFELSYVQSIT
jgi:hypothetical protein